MGNNVQIFVILILVKLAACASGFEFVKLNSFKNEASGDSYQFSYTLSDGQSRSEKGVKTRLGDAEFYEVTGSYTFEAPDGKNYLVDYTSGINGYKATVKEREFIKIILKLSPDVIKSLVG